MQGWIVIPVSLAYLMVLFLIAWYGDRHSTWLERWRPWIYSLSIAVYCTSWIFFGTVGQASSNPWSFLPIYLAPIVAFTCFWRVIARLILVAKREHITSIADFIAARYGKSQGLAVVVTLIAVIGVLPYIALQLRGIMMGVEIIAPDLASLYGNESDHISWFIVLALAVFTMLFGTRYIDSTEHHRGMMKAIAFESTIKLVAFLIVGVFIVSLTSQHPDISLLQIAAETYQAPNIPTLLIHTFLALMAIFCLPRQFHTMVVENEKAQDLRTARWLFPLYLILMSLFVLPIAWVGQALMGGGTSDAYVISVPMQEGASHIALLAFLGGMSAASGMVIVSTIALAIMVSNDLVMPLLLRRMRLSQRDYRHFSKLLLIIRRALILLLLVGAWGFYKVLDSIHSLSAIGLLSFAAIAQFAPALIGGMYWRQGNRKGVYVGLAVGFTLWLVTLMSRTDMLAGSAESNVLLWVISPPDWLTAWEVSTSDWGMALSFIANTACYVTISSITRSNISERLQAAAFIGVPLPESENMTLYQSRVSVSELEMLAARFIGQHRVNQAFEHYWSQQREVLSSHQQAPASLIRHTERVLAGIFGASSAKLVLTSALQGKNMQLEEVATIVDEASELYDFSRSLLQGSIEHISQGLAVVDKQLRLVAWNQRYLELFDFSPGLIQVGRPIADLIRHNAEQGLCGPGDVDDHVRRRVYHLKQGTRHTSSRTRPDGRVIEVQGNPLPGGGFVMSFSDITVFRQAEQTLQATNEVLEERVKERTQALEALNQQLVSATQRSERESQSKSRFLAAVSHDLMQPLNAARLFASSLSEVAQEVESRKLAQHIESALGAAEDLISDLLDMSRLESGKMASHVHAFAIKDVFDNLRTEFGALASQQHIDFSVITSNVFVMSDPKLLRRIVQNFLTNAFRYSPQGKVVLGLRHCGEQVRIEVWDNGIGIEKSQQQAIFNEFTRVNQIRSDQGLGLGLAISKGIAEVLNHHIAMRSWPGCGSVFSLTLPRAHTPTHVHKVSAGRAQFDVAGLKVLCVDNEEHILTGMADLLGRWGCDVRTALDLVQSLKVIDKEWMPAVILSDYRLDNDRTGLELLQQWRLRFGMNFEGVIISAERSDEMLKAIREHGFEFLPKPVKPLKLRTFLGHLAEKSTAV